MYVEFLVKIFKVLTNNALMIFFIVLMYIQRTSTLDHT